MTVPTADIFTVGQTAPFSRYRVVANTSNPSVFYSSPVDSAYSIDNLAPPKPNGFVIEASDWRIVGCADPQIADLTQVCFYRGTTSGFEPNEALSCSPGMLSYYESQMNNYRYRIQFKDIHGNLSEFSDELPPQSPLEPMALCPSGLLFRRTNPIRSTHQRLSNSVC
ncbi:MAG: hypothetical protein IPP62_04195 [bacterium]|nr:hypothetical protein [bacterium]